MTASTFSHAELATLVRRLSPARAAAPRDDWAKVAMAIKSADSGDFGLQLFDDFSRQAPEKYDPRAVRSTWQSVRPAGGISAGSLVHWANEDDPAGRQAPQSAQSTKRAYAGLVEYAAAHHAPADAFRAAGWRETTHRCKHTRSDRPALAFPTVTGTRWRFLDDQKPTYDSPAGYRRCWYRLAEAVELAGAAGSPLVLCNGEASTVAAQAHSIAACAVTGGEKAALPAELLAELRAAWTGEIVIAFDSDKTGRQAAPQMAEQLRQAGYHARAVELGGAWGFDLADFCGLHREDTMQALVELLEQASAAAAAQPAEQLDQAASDPRPRIAVRNLDLKTIAPAAWDALISANDPPELFRRDGLLYEVGRDDRGGAVLVEVDKRRLRSRLARAALFVEQREKQGHAVEWAVEPPSAVLDDLLVRIDARIPIITRITRAPLITADGAIIDQPGYHAAARIFYDPRPGITMPAVPEQPTAGDVAAARALILDELLCDFPFVDQADRAHAAALLLLPFVREAIDGPTPLHLIEAPTMGSGKTLLADALLMPALGATLTPITEAGDDDEWRKRITSLLASTPPAIYIDNVNRTLAGGALAAALTATTWSDRLLGTNATMSAPVRAVWVATANNPTLSGEVARRCIRIRIDPRQDRPWQRGGFRHANLRQWVREHEGEIIGAALTLIRYGLQHGETAGASLGSYEAWAALLGRILGAAGIPGFLGNLDELYDRADTEGAAWRALISAWWEKHAGEAVPVGDLFDLYRAGDYDLSIQSKDDKGLRVAFGKRLRKQQDRVIDGYQVVNAGTARGRVQLWQLRQVTKPAPTPTPTPRGEDGEDGEDFDPQPMHMRELVDTATPACEARTHVHVESEGLETFTTFTTFTKPSTSVDGPLTGYALSHALQEHQHGGAPAVVRWLQSTGRAGIVPEALAQLHALGVADEAAALPAGA